MKKNLVLLPIFFGFFVMGFSDIISTAMIRIREECQLSDMVAGALPMMIFVWFLLISIPTGILCGRIGRKNTVLTALFITVGAMLLPFAASAERFWIYFVAFALIGIGNTMLQAALPALIANVVSTEQLTSRISFGQFVKAICATVTPLVALAASKALGNWKYMFLIYGALSLVAGLWLWFWKIPREEATAEPASFRSSVALLANPYILAMAVGIVFAVGADVGFDLLIPEYLKHVFSVSTDLAATGSSVYFFAKMSGAFLGAFIFAYVPPAKCFPFAAGLAVAATAAQFFAPTPIVFLALVFVSSLGLSNLFGMCMGLAIDRLPAKANEISALMVMAIVGGGIASLAKGWVQSVLHARGIVIVPLACLVYLLGLGVFAACRCRRAKAVSQG